MDFHFAVARVTAAQLCRASGIERCSRTALNMLTDVLVRYLQLLARTASEAAEDSNKDEPDVSDVALALADCGVVQLRIPDSEGSDVDEFLEWLRGPAPQRALQAAKPHRQMLSSLGSVLPASGTNPLLGSLGMELPEPTADWLRSVVNQQILVGHQDKFRHTEFDLMPTPPHTPGSAGAPPEIAGGPPTIDDFYASRREEPSTMSE